MTDRYGVFLARLLPEIAKSDSWTSKAELVDRKKNKTLASRSLANT
jgi:predicted nuclease of restriction endonuclease-like RecB superfamily